MVRTKPSRRTGKDGQVTQRELTRIIWHYRRQAEFDYDVVDSTVAAGLLERYDIRPKEPADGQA